MAKNIFLRALVLMRGCARTKIAKKKENMASIKATIYLFHTCSCAQRASKNVLAIPYNKMVIKRFIINVPLFTKFGLATLLKCLAWSGRTRRVQISRLFVFYRTELDNNKLNSKKILTFFSGEKGKEVTEHLPRTN